MTVMVQTLLITFLMTEACTINMNEAGTISFDGRGGVSAMHSIDDMLPYADTAGWDMMSKLQLVAQLEKEELQELKVIIS